jgi:hypothetical protein
MVTKSGVVPGYFVSATEFEEYLKVRDLLPKALAGKEHSVKLAFRIEFRTGGQSLAKPHRPHLDLRRHGHPIRRGRSSSPSRPPIGSRTRRLAIAGPNTVAFFGRPFAHPPQFIGCASGTQLLS